MTCCRLSPEQGGNDGASKGARDRGTNSTDATWALYVLDVLSCAPASNRTEQDDGDMFRDAFRLITLQNFFVSHLSP